MLAVSAYSLLGIIENSKRSYAVTTFIRAIYAIGAFALFDRIPGQTFGRSSLNREGGANNVQLVTYESICTLVAGALTVM